MPWVLAAAAVSAGATLFGSSNASHAAQSAADAQSAATQANIAENQREFDTIQANNAGARRAGDASLSALGGAFGLPGYGPAPSMTGRSGPQQAQPGQVMGDPGVSMTARTGSGSGNVSPGDAPISGPFRPDAGFGPNQPAAGASMAGGSNISYPGVPAGAQPDWDGYIAQHPDVQAWIAAGHGDPNLGPNQTPEQAAAFQYANSYTLGTPFPPPPTMTGPATTAPASGPGGYVAPAGYSDPTAPNGYDPGSRPDLGPRPDAGAAPGFYKPGALDVSLGSYQQSPDYNFRLGEGNKALDHVASQMGGLMSGARLKAADRYNQDFATTDYNNWRDYTSNRYDVANNFGNQLAMEQLGQYNTDRSRTDTNYSADRARSDGLYQDDRSFLAGQYNNRTGQLMTLAGFGANANASNANAGQSFAASDAAQRNTGATAQGNASIAGANAFTSGVNNLMTTGAYLGGQYLAGGGAGSYYGVNPATNYSLTDLKGLY